MGRLGSPETGLLFPFPLCTVGGSSSQHLTFILSWDSFACGPISLPTVLSLFFRHLAFLVCKHPGLKPSNKIRKLNLKDIIIALKTCVAGTWLNALNRFGITQTLAQLCLCHEAAKETAKLVHNDWTYLIIEGCGFFPFQVNLLYSRFQGLVFSEVEIWIWERSPGHRGERQTLLSSTME